MCFFADWRPSKATTYFIFLFLSPYSPPPNDSETLPNTFHRGRAPSPISSPQQTPTFGWLLCFPNQMAATWLRTRSPLCFSMGCISAPKTREPTAAPPNPMVRALHGTIGSGGAMSWRHRWPTHGWRGPKPLEGRVAAAHVGCCVFWLCGCVVARVLYPFCRLDHPTHGDFPPLFNARTNAKLLTPSSADESAYN